MIGQVFNNWLQKRNLWLILYMHTVIKHRRNRVHLPAVEELVVLERIELIARLGVCYESQAKDKDIALIWISELAGEMKTSISPEKAAVIQQLTTVS
ncbi:Uncharacterised protein [Serratia plymuthica]|nr:Uncharacterised protein [Serratia plymuthica]